MALYLGSSGKQKVNIDGVVYCLNLYSTTDISDSIRLLSSDNYILKDFNGLYLTAKEDE